MVCKAPKSAPLLPHLYLSDLVWPAYCSSLLVLPSCLLLSSCTGLPATPWTHQALCCLSTFAFTPSSTGITLTSLHLRDSAFKSWLKCQQGLSWPLSHTTNNSPTPHAPFLPFYFYSMYYHLVYYIQFTYFAYCLSLQNKI